MVRWFFLIPFFNFSFLKKIEKNPFQINIQVRIDDLPILSYVAQIKKRKMKRIKTRNS